MSKVEMALGSAVERVKSPCVNVCRMSAQGWCEGCYRTLDEIGDWSDMSADQQRAVWGRIEQRRTRVQSDF
jgi:predicted Fe-S protein YdhL (DUF1289 family)